MSLCQFGQLDWQKSNMSEIGKADVRQVPFSLKVFLPSDGTTNGKEMPGGFQPVPAISLHHLACLSDWWLC